MKTLILEGRLLKRRSKKIETKYMALAPGECWVTTFEGQRISIIADKDNTSNVYVGQRKQSNMRRRLLFIAECLFALLLPLAYEEWKRRVL